MNASRGNIVATLCCMIMAWCPVYGFAQLLTGADPAPREVNFTAQLSIPGPIDFDGELPPGARVLRDILPPGVQTILTISPLNFSVDHLLDPCGLVGKADSSQATYRADTGTLATYPVPHNDLQCGTLATPIPAVDNPTLPTAVQNYVRERILDTPLPRTLTDFDVDGFNQAIQDLVLSQTVVVDFVRRWVHDTDASTANAVVNLLFNSTANARLALNLCRLETASVLPPPQTAVLGARTTSASIPLTWNTTSRCFGTGFRPITISSSQYTIKTLEGAPLQTVQNTISKPGQTLGTATFAETVTVPSSAILAAASSGANSVLVERTFTDGRVTRTVSARVFLGGPASASFSITRLALRYDDGSRVKIIPEDGPLRVLADVNFNGAGLLEAQWEIAGPTAPGGAPFFRPMQLVRRYLVGSQYVSLQSPPLPSRVNGMYFVRLVIRNPSGISETPLLRYFVGEYSEESSVALRRGLPETMSSLSPAPGAVAEPGQRFAWTAVERAASYQVEIYPLNALDDRFTSSDEPGAHSSLVVRRGPVTGVAVPGESTSADMSQLVRGYLEPGTYWWRVVANDENGAVIATGPLRRLEVR